MQWRQVLSDAGLSDREVNAVMVLSTKSSLKASELAKELGTTRLDAYNSLERETAIHWACQNNSRQTNEVLLPPCP